MCRLALASLVLAALGACGARTGLGDGLEVDGPSDGGREDAPPARPTCRDQPSCIEADLTLSSGEEIAFAREGEVPVAEHMAAGAWLETPEDEVPTMAVQLSLDAVPGPVELSLNPAHFYVDLRFTSSHCNIRGEGHLDVVDVTAGGVSEGTFAGATSESCLGGVHQVQDGWFRLTMP